MDVSGHDDSVKPYHDQIRQARGDNLKESNHDIDNDSNGTTSGNDLKKHWRKLKKVRTKVEKLKEERRRLQGLVTNNSTSDEDDDEE